MNIPVTQPSAKNLYLIIYIVLSTCFVLPALGYAQEKNNRRLLLRDEGLSQMSLIDLHNPSANWYLPVPAGRDIQLVGQNRVLLGTGNGYEERDINTGNKLFEVTSFPGTIAARRLRNGHTLLTGANWQGKQGIVLIEIDENAVVKKTIVYPGFSYVRLVRETAAGNFLITSDETVFEGNAAGDIVWRATIVGREKPHAWQALRLANGQTIVSSGYAGNLQFFSADGSLLKTITGPAEVNPVFYAGYQILNNGNIIITNWQGHGPKFGASGIQLLEYTNDGKLVWSWKQDAGKFSSLQAVILLDDLDTRQLHIENEKGILAPVK